MSISLKNHQKNHRGHSKLCRGPAVIKVVRKCIIAKVKDTTRIVTKKDILQRIFDITQHMCGGTVSSSILCIAIERTLGEKCFYMTSTYGIVQTDLLRLTANSLIITMIAKAGCLSLGILAEIIFNCISEMNVRFQNIMESDVQN